MAQNSNASGNLVTLHHFGRGKNAPSISPFVIKLETYLRMAGVPYKSSFGSKLSPQKKIPWIEYKGVAIGDSQLIIEMLNRERNMNLDSELSDEQLATSRAYRRLIEESLYWSITWCAFATTSQAFKADMLGSKLQGFVVHHFVTGKIKKTLNAVGFGRHDDKTKLHMIRGDLRALSRFLGTKKYLMGDEVSEIDACLFGFLSCFIAVVPDSPMAKMIDEEFGNLKEYWGRIREKYWPDWEDCTREGEKRKRRAQNRPAHR